MHMYYTYWDLNSERLIQLEESSSRIQNQNTDLEWNAVDYHLAFPMALPLLAITCFGSKLPSHPHSFDIVAAPLAL